MFHFIYFTIIIKLSLIWVYQALFLSLRNVWIFSLTGGGASKAKMINIGIMNFLYLKNIYFGLSFVGFCSEIFSSLLYWGLFCELQYYLYLPIFYLLFFISASVTKPLSSIFLTSKNCLYLSNNSHVFKGSSSIASLIIVF